MQGIDINQVITLVQELKYLIRKIEGTEDENGILNALDKSGKQVHNAHCILRK